MAGNFPVADAGILARLRLGPIFPKMEGSASQDHHQIVKPLIAGTTSRSKVPFRHLPRRFEWLAPEIQLFVLSLKGEKPKWHRQKKHAREFPARVVTHRPGPVD